MCARRYASPIAVAPRTWAVSIYRPTLTHSNWLARGSGVLQLMTDPHSPLAYALGGRSGAAFDKAAACAAAGFPWSDASAELGSPERLLPGCASYLRLVQVGELTSCGEHDVAICRVEGMVVPDQSAEGAATMGDALSTARLRELGMISDRGKAVSPPELQQ